MFSIFWLQRENRGDEKWVIDFPSEPTKHNLSKMEKNVKGRQTSGCKFRIALLPLSKSISKLCFLYYNGITVINYNLSFLFFHFSFNQAKQMYIYFLSFHYSTPLTKYTRMKIHIFSHFFFSLTFLSSQFSIFPNESFILSK